MSYGGVNTILPVSALWPTFRSGMEVSGSGKNVHVALFYVALIILAFDVLVALFGADSRPIDAERATRWFPGTPRD